MTITFKQYLAEAKAVTRDQAKDYFKTIVRQLRPDMHDDFVREVGKDPDRWWDYSIRHYDLFTSRPGEEDDDHPNFTGDKQLNKALKSILKGVEFQFWPEEKSWITIRIKAKKLSAKDIKADAKKKIEPVINATRNAYFDAKDRHDRDFYDGMLNELKKWKKKFITKEEYFDLTKKVSKWNNDELANEAWASA